MQGNRRRQSFGRGVCVDDGDEESAGVIALNDMPMVSQIIVKVALAGLRKQNESGRCIGATAIGNDQGK